MNTKQKMLNYLLITTAIVTLAACGGGGGGGKSCLVKQPDSDGDGFIDMWDPAPNDASNPGDFSSPEKILANPKVQKALAQAKAHGVDIAPQLGTNPPKLMGYYHRDYGIGYVVASETGIKNGAVIYGVEKAVCSEGSWYQQKTVEFIESGAEEFHFADYNVYLRGEGNQFTYYENYTASCDRGGRGSFTYILSANLDDNSNWVNARSVEVQLAGSPSCEAWKVRTLGTYAKVNDPEDLTHMCADNGRAYLLGETWKNRDGESCKCTAGYETVCE